MFPIFTCCRVIANFKCFAVKLMPDQVTLNHARKIMRTSYFARLVILLAGFLCLLQPWPSLAEDAKAEFPQNPSLDDLFTLYQPYLGNISAYEPIYFLVGTNPEYSKFQFSFRYRLFNLDGPLAHTQPWTKGLHLGYTQTSFWDLKSDSAPFEDTSYKPEFFHLTANMPWRPSWLKGLFIQSGLRHESNGRGELESRSTNILYLKPIGILYDGASGLGMQISPKFWLYVNNSDETNADLPDYRGYFDLEIKMGKADGLVGSGQFHWAKEGGSVQIDLNYPLQQYLSDNLQIYLHFQYSNSLAESLLYYQERTEAFRLGFSVVR